ncbi:MAG: esterase, partial [Chloracidobacterium sp.]|nr:esterase [Chloracidobacterium sp.]
MKFGNLGRMTACAGSVLMATAVFAFSALAQSAAPANQQTPAPVVISPEVSADQKITFRLLAPQAENVKLTGSDIPGVLSGKAMTKGDNGLWELTLGPIAPGSYRYNFNVNGVAVIDPRNNLVSESNNNVWSLVHVPGSEYSDTKNVPHGAVAAVTYYSTALGKLRR